MLFRFMLFKKGDLMKANKPLLAGIIALAASTTLATRAQAQTCTTDADCSAGMLCHSQTVSQCTGGAAVAPCPPNTVCEPIKVEPTNCTESQVSQCAYRWQLPCGADADCGEGFGCHAAMTCSGSAPSATGGGAADMPTPAREPPPTGDAGVVTPPTCTTSFPGTCQPKATSCNTDSDCPSQWTCGASSIGIAVAPPSRVDAGAGTTLPPDMPVSNEMATTTTTTTIVKTCQSPNTRTGGNDSSGGTQGTGTITLAANNPDAGAGNGTTPTVPPVVAPSNEGAASTDTKTSTTTTMGAKTGSGGCSVGTGDATGGTLLLLGLGAAVALLGRKRDRQ